MWVPNWKVNRIAAATLVLAATLLAPQRLFARLSPADATALANDLTTLSGSWNQPAVDESNAILTRPEYSAADLTEFFASFFSSHLMTEGLRNYLVYPTFFWFDDTVHLKLQTALSDVLWQRIAALTPQVATDVNVRISLLSSHRFLNYFTASSVLPTSGQEQLYQRYRAHLLQYPQYYSLAYTQRDWPFLGSLRVQVVINLVELTTLTDVRKSEIAASLSLTGQKLGLWNNLTALVIDNDGLDYMQLQALAGLYQMTPRSLFSLRFLTVFDFLRSQPDNSDAVFPIVSKSANTTVNNIFGLRVGSIRENQFPPDVDPYDTDVFSIVVAHELNHVVDARSVSSNSELTARRRDLLARAADVSLQYLRSQIGGPYFQAFPQEFFASIANQYFANSKRTLELALRRLSMGYREPMNQFLFFANVYSTGNDLTYFYTLDEQGRLARQSVPVRKDSSGHIYGIQFDGRLYTFPLTTEGFVTGPPEISLAAPGLRFVPVPPCRLADTREASLGAFGTPALVGNAVRSFAIPQRPGCNIPATASAYSLNVTVVPRGPLGYLTIFPTGATQPFVSTLNSLDGRIKANAAIVPAGTGGAVSVYVTNATELILDINGYFTDPAINAQALSFYPVPPCRVADTRNPNGSLGGPILAAGAGRNFPVLSSNCGVPATAQAYSVNATAVPPAALGFLTLWPSGQTQPVVSTLNALTGAVTANAAIVPAGANGQISAFASSDSHLVLDINGYFAPPGAANAQGFFTVAPCRLLDTRNAAQEFGGPVLEGGNVRSYRLPLANCNLPGTAAAFSLNATVVPTTSLGFLTLWPSGVSQPLVSTLNAIDGSITSNAAIVPAGTAGAVASFVTNQTHLILDTNGYFAP